MNVSDLIEHHNKYNLKERDKPETPGKRYQREYQEIKDRHWQETQRKLLLANLKTN